MAGFQFVRADWHNHIPVTLNLRANIGQDVSGKRIKCAHFEGFTPIS
jgi:hypothetical protein